MRATEFSNDDSQVLREVDNLRPYYQCLDTVFYVGHVLDVLRDLPDQHFHCAVTSPPYFGLRNYHLPPVRFGDGWVGSLGLEPRVELFIEHLVEVFAEVRRVLRHDGTLWVNINDSYAGSGVGWQKDDSSSIPRKWLSETGCDRPPAYISSRQPNGIKPKDLFGVPWRLALALQSDGWYLRSDVIWEKPNSLPESVRDRPSRSHEYLFLLSKREHYFFDAEAIKEPLKPETLERYDRGGHRGVTEMPTGGRNKRTVWHINTEAFNGPHHAVFPTELVRNCLLASTSEKGCCPNCGNQWIRKVVRTGHVNKRKPSQVPRGGNNTQTSSTGWAPVYQATNEWQPGCTCGDEPTIACRVLDPFGGAGTTAVVARQLGRHSVYIDLSQQYADIAIQRLQGQALHLPLLNTL